MPGLNHFRPDDVPSVKPKIRFGPIVLWVTFAMVAMAALGGCSQGLTPSEASNLAVVQGYLYAGEPVHAIKLYQMIPYGSRDTVPNPIVLRNNVELVQGATVYPLTADSNGIYHSDHIVQAGDVYTLRFRYGVNSISALTTVPHPVSSVTVTNTRFALDSLKRVVLDRGDTLVFTERDTLIFPNGDTAIVKPGRIRPQHVAYGTEVVLNSPDTLVVHPADTVRADSVPRNNRAAYRDSVRIDVNGVSTLYLAKRPDTASITNRSKAKSTTPGDTLYPANGDTVRFTLGDTLVRRGKPIVMDTSAPILIEAAGTTRSLTFGALPTLRWKRGDSSYVYVKIQNVDSAPETISKTTTTTPATGGFGPGGPAGPGGPVANFQFTAAPSQSDSLRITAQMISQYGKHYALVYRVNPEYRALFTSTQVAATGSTATTGTGNTGGTGNFGGAGQPRGGAQATGTGLLTEAATNVLNGLGVFTAFSADTVVFTVRKPATP